MTAAIQTFLGAIILVSINANYVNKATLGCNDNVYWSFGETTNITIPLNGIINENRDNVCEIACNKDINCNGWLININKNECYLYTFIDGPLIYNCQSNNINKYYGKIKKCINNNKLISNNIIPYYDNQKNKEYIYNEKGCIEPAKHFKYVGCADNKDINIESDNIHKGINNVNRCIDLCSDECGYIGMRKDVCYCMENINEMTINKKCVKKTGVIILEISQEERHLTLTHPIFKGNYNDDMFIEFGGGKIRKIIWDLNDNNDVILSKYITNDVRNDNNIGYDNDIHSNKCDDIILEFNEYINGYRIGYNIIGNIKGLQFNTNLNNKYICGTFNNLDYDSKLILFNDKYLSGFYYNDNNNVINKISFQFNKLTADITSLHKRRLNNIYYRRVLTDIGPLTVQDDIGPDYEMGKYVLSIDKSCAESNANNGGKNYQNLIKDILEIVKSCVYELNADGGYNHDGIFDAGNEWAVFLKDISTSECLNGLNIDHQSYCISNFRHSMIFKVAGLPTCSNNIIADTGEWALGAMLNNEYFSDFNVNNLNVYVLDSKVNLGNSEFGYLPFKVDLGGLNEQNDHGSHVAGIILGASYGVIRDPETRFYTYGSCRGDLTCPENWIVNGLTAVLINLNNSPGRRGVINMSLGGRCGTTTACSAAIENGIRNIRNHPTRSVVVVSAGNDNDDACLYGPARLPEVITVGNHNINLVRRFSSNFGDCIDTWAPGTGIRSAYFFGNGLNTGTSMSSPAIAGLVGAWILIRPSLEFDEIQRRLQCRSPFDNCYWMDPVPVIDARSRYNRRFNLDCDDVYWMFFTLSPTKSTISPTKSTNAPTVSPTKPTESPTLSPTKVCEKPCSSITFGKPCKHASPGDFTCHDYSITGACPQGTSSCEIPGADTNSCLLCRSQYPCQHNNDGSCTPMLPNSVCPPGTTLCPGITPSPMAPTMMASICSKACNPLTFGLPCMHLNPSDNSCFNYISSNICPPNTVDCSIMGSSPCDSCTASLPCLHDTANTCVSPDAFGFCYPGTTRCSAFPSKIQEALRSIKYSFNTNKEMVVYVIIMICILSCIMGALCLGCILFIIYKCCNNKMNKREYAFKAIDSEVTTDVIQSI